MLTIIIVSWNTERLLHQCLDSVISAIPADCSCNVVVVDNASTDSSVEMVRELFPGIHLIVNHENSGFSRANNQALAYCFHNDLLQKYVLFLNSDVIVSGNLFREMVDVFESNDRIGAASPALLLPDRSFQPGAAGFRISSLSAFIYFSLLFRVIPLPLAKGMFIEQGRYAHMSEPATVDWVSGACLFARKEVIMTIGGWDESSFMYAEDIDLCEKIRKHGYLVMYLPFYSVLHHHGASSMATDTINTRWLTALFAYVRRTRGPGEFLIFRALTIGGIALRLCCYGILSLFYRERFGPKRRQIWHYFVASFTGN